jgi:hypothetical protein
MKKKRKKFITIKKKRSIKKNVEIPVKKFKYVTESDKDRMVSGLRLLCNEIEEIFSVKTLLCGGTFLAAYRDRDFIPYDDDIDIYYYCGNNSSDNVQKICSKICAYYKNKGRLRYWIKRCHYHIAFHDNFYFADLFPAWEDNGSFFCGGPNTRIYSGLDINEVIPLQQIEFRNNIFNIPKNPEAYAKWQWGETWNKKIKMKHGYYPTNVKISKWIKK